MILSVPEGDDKPLKYPLMFQVSDIVLVNKIDALPVFDFNKTAFEQNVHLRHPGMPVLYISAKTGEGFDAWLEWLTDEASRVCKPAENDRKEG